MITVVEQIEPKTLKAILRKGMQAVAKKHNYKPIDAWDFPLDALYRCKYLDGTEVREQVITYAELVKITNKLIEKKLITMQGLEAIAPALI